MKSRKHIGSYLDKEKFLDKINEMYPPICTDQSTGRHIQKIQKEEVNYILNTYFQDVLKKYWNGYLIRSDVCKDMQCFHPYLMRRVRKILLADGFTDKKIYWKKTFFK